MAENLEKKAVEVKQAAEKPNESEWQKQHEEREAEREAIRSLTQARNARTYEGIVYKHANPTPNPIIPSREEIESELSYS